MPFASFGQDLPDLVREAVGSPSTVGGTAARVAVVYLILLIAIRLTGRRVLGQMTPFDLLTLLLLSNVVQNAMIGPDNSLTGGVLGAGVLLLMNRAVAGTKWIRHRLETDPVLLVHHGQLFAERLAREGISEAELATAVREHGVESVAGVETAVLEMDGTISVIPSGTTAPVRLRRVRSTRNR